MCKYKPTPSLACNKNVEFYTILMWRLIIIFFTVIFLYSIYSLQVLLQGISLSHPWPGLNFRILQNISRNVLFSFTNLSQDNFLYGPKFFIPTKVPHTACTPSELKQNLLHWHFFRQLCQVIQSQAIRVQPFSQPFKISFLIVIGREQNYTSASLQEDHK